jgi:hypothetical protein
MISAFPISTKVISVIKHLHLRLIESVPFLIACAVFLSVISLKSPVLLFCLIVGSLVTIVIQQVGQQVQLSTRSLRDVSRSRILFQILAAALLLSCFWLDYFASPAVAQFFKGAEDFFKKTLTQGSNSNNSPQEAISLIFNVLRAIYLLYIAISLVGIINAVRQDDDWQSVARIPLLVIIAVTIADVLTGFIIGNGGK